MWGVAFGLLLAGTGAVLIAVGSRSLDAAAARRTALLEAAFVASPASPQYEQFTRTGTFGYAMDDPVFTSVYLWNLTNAEDVLAGRAAPRVAQIGPYVYEKKTRKVNVTFHSTLPPTTEDAADAADAAKITEDYGYVSYGVAKSYAFDAARSNGSERDRVVTLNATYARQLSKYRALGYSERLVVAQYAQQHMAEYDRHLRHEFIADTKQRGLQFFLPQAIDTLTRESVRPAIQRQREQIDSASIPRNLVQMYAVARTEAIPQVLGDVMNDITDRFLPSILQSQFDAAKNHALPRVVSNLLNRLKVEAVPDMLRKQIETQYARQVPFTLNSLANKLPQLAFPYVMQELFERACIEAVPFILRTIKLEIIARDTATNQNQADVAQNNVLEAWRFRSSSDRVDFDTWIDGSPMGTPRTGFELRPPTDDLQLSKEAATLILGSKTSNKRFSIIDYDVQKTATYPLDTPTDTPVGFAIWKQVIAMNETSISCLIDGVNNDVARQSDYITREQVMYIRDYLIQWAKSDVVRRDRERFWLQNYVKRTTDSDFNEPAVDLDIEKPGTQAGFNLQASGPSSSGVTLTIARQLWTATDPFSFLSIEGFTLWYQAAILQSSPASQTLQAGITGFTTAHFSEVSTWVSKLFSDGVVLRRAQRHWADGTCLDSFKLPRPSCILYDLEPHVPGVQTGFEMNPQSDSAIVVSQALREELWDPSKPSSFLFAVQAAETKTGFGLWLQAVRGADTSDVLKLLSTTHPTFTTSGATGIAQWLRRWFTNDLHTLNIQNWWRTGTCWPREKLPETAPTSTTTSALSSCTSSYKETEQSAQALAAGDPQSPFSTTQRVLRVDEVKCDLDSVSSNYTKTESSYQYTVKEYSCEVFSTELSDDHTISDFKTGFELAPLITLADAGLRPSLAVTSALWDPSNTFSFLHPDGYKQWVFDFVGSPAAVRTSLANAINARVPAVCSKLVAAGVRSAIFNATIVGTDGYCGFTAANQMDAIQKWVSSISGSTWMESALLDQWRRGELASGIDIEPYRPEMQVGWELSSGCECSLTSIQGTKYEVPRAALALWQAKTHPATFLTPNGYKLWSDVIDVLGTDDASAITGRKQEIITACSLSTWEPWLDRVVAWLKVLKANEHLVRDVLGHWIQGTCPTPSSLDVISVVSEGSPNSSVQASCPPGNDRYKVALNVSLDDILLAASRPTFSHYFDPKIVEKSALIQPSKVVEETETIIGCEYKAANQVTVTTQTRVRNKKYLSCNFLSVLSEGTTASVPIVERETHFEMNRTSEGSYVSMEVAQAAWLNSSTTEWAFTNVDVFLNKWQRAIDRAEELSALQVVINGAIVSIVPTALQDMVQYLKMWETSSDSVREIGKVWLRSSSPFYDLDPSLDGSQGGFELFSSAGWRKIFDLSTDSLPTLGQAQYLWDANNEYSFLNVEAQLRSNDLPIGFNAWREIYDGVDFSSDRLLDKYPEVATVERDNAVHRLSGSDRTALLALMASATSLTIDQIRAISSWLMAWSENNVLRDYILETWATGRTPRGEEDTTIDLSVFIPARFKLKYMPSSAMAVDVLTTNTGAFVLKSIPKMIRRKLWDVSASGSLLNPISREVWCLLDVPNVGVCAHVLDDLGFVNTTSLSAFVEAVQPIVQDLQTISRSSNFTSLALQYFERQFGLSEEQTIVIATWWRSLPTKSTYFQALQAQRWQLPADGLVAQRADPLWFGFGLVDVFPINEGRISRRATSDDLVSNTVDITPAKCRISLELVIVLWRSNAPSSFLHSTAWKTWLDYAEQTTPRGTNAFLKSLSDSDATFKAITSRLASASARCTVEAIANWLLSWESHPYTRLFVERLWYQVSTSPASPTAKVVDPSALMLAIPIDGGVSLAPRPELALRVHARLAELMFDLNESVALTNLTTGFPLWRALLTECTSTNVTTFKCEPSSDAEAKRKAVSSAVDVLSLKFVERLQSIDPGLSVTKENVGQAIRTIVVPWLLYWLDHTLLLRFILQDAAKVDASLAGRTDTLTYNDFPAIQFTSSTFSRVTYSLPRDGPDETTYVEHEGVASERLTCLRRGFDIDNSTILQEATEGHAGFGELAAFCSWNKFDRVYAYDATTTCSLGTTYDVPIPEAKAIFATLSDPTDWASADGKLSAKRASLLIDAFLAQPFASTQACTLTIENLALAYELASDTKQRACKITANGVLLDLPLLSDMGLTSSLARIKDLQAYLRYAATKFVYEPRVLGISAPVLQSANLTQPPSILETWSVYPIGGYITAQTVARVASPTSLATSLWQTADVNVSNPSVNTYLVPTRSDPQLVTKNRERVLGELVVLNGSTKAVILGASFRLSLGHFTDGSQFATAIGVARHDPIFPPPKLRFYWEYARRIIVLSYVKNVTRFGIPLMRYTIDNWQEPSNLPSGLDAAAIGDKDAPSGSVNVSALFSDLTLVLSSAPSTPSASPLDQTREAAVDIDPVTGIVYHRRLSWQLTARVSGADAADDLWHRQVSNGWLPVAWLREQHSVSPSSALEFVANTAKSGPFAPEKLAMWGVVGGCAYVVVGLAVSVVYAKRARVMRIRKQQSVMPAGLPSPVKQDPSKGATASTASTSTTDVLRTSVDKQVAETSDVNFSASGLIAVHSSPQARKRTVSRVQTIAEDREDALDIQQV